METRIAYYAQYCRIQSAAGGLRASNRALIRAARKRLAATGKARAQRTARHIWIRELLAFHESAQRTAREFRLA